MARRSALPTSGAAFLVLAVVCVSLASAPGTASVPTPLPLDTVPPVADAGPDQAVDEDTPVTLDGSGSTDDVGIVNYTWSLPASVGAVRTVLSGSLAGPAVFDPVRPLVYVLGSRSVSVVNLTTGTVDRTYGIDHEPTYPLSLAVAPGGTYLAVGIPAGERGYYFFGPYLSYIMTVDLVAQSKIGEFVVDEDIYRVVVTTDGYVILTGGSGQWSSIRMLDARTGVEEPQRGIIWQYNSISLHPSERRLYSVDETGIYPPGVHRYDFAPGTGIISETYWPYHGAYPGYPIWAGPTLIVTGDGYVLSSTDNASEDMRSIGRFDSGILTAAFGAEQGLVALSTGTRLVFYEMSSLALLGSKDLGTYTYATALLVQGEEVLAYAGGDVFAVVARLYRYGVSVTHTFEQPGVHTVTLSVRDAAGNADSDTADVTVRDVTPPVAFAGPDRVVDRGATEMLDGNGSTDNVGIVDYVWTFDDGGPVLLSGVVVYYTFQNEGLFAVELTVRDAANNEGTDVVLINVTRDMTPPVAVAGPDQTVLEGTTVYFDGGGSFDNQGIASYTWTLDDGGAVTLSGPTAEYRFANPGVFEVTLTVVDLESNVDTDLLVVTVTSDTIPPVAFAGFDMSTYVGVRVVFDGTRSTDNVGIVNFTWTFDDGGSRTLYGGIATYRFMNAGAHDVTLTVRDARQHVGTDVVVVTVAAVSLTEYGHVDKGFRIGVPTGWRVTLDFTVSQAGTVDLFATDPVNGSRRAQLFVVSEARAVEATDAFLLSQAQQILSEMPSQLGFVIIEQAPEIVAVSNTRVAWFEVSLPNDGLRQVWAIAANPSRQRLYAIVGSADINFFGNYRHLFSASILSFGIRSPLESLGSDVLIVLTIGTLAGVAFAVLIARAFVRSRPGRSGSRTGPNLPPATGDQLAAKTPGTPTRCPRCGSSLAPPYRFCPSCGLVLGPPSEPGAERGPAPPGGRPPSSP